ncbi:MAG: DegV family protein [Anaerolineae bacterium]|nr:DegV family protein [Anaerolineae bacterium]
MIKIVTDTTCDMPGEWFSQYQITTIPMNIQFGLETFREGVTITRDTFYRRIDAEGNLPTTSQPSVGEFIELYETLAADGNEILSIHLTSKLSGTWQSAFMAARQLQGKIKVTVVDSLTGSPGLGFMVREAAQLSAAGWTAAQIVPHLEARRAQINVFIMLKDLRYARMSGRVGRLRETIASLLDIKPIVGVEEGNLVPIDRVRTQKNGFQRMLMMAQAQLGQTPVHVGMVHAMAQAEAEALLAQVESRLNCRDTFVTNIALSLAVHFGPGTVGFATYPAEEM